MWVLVCRGGVNRTCTFTKHFQAFILRLHFFFTNSKKCRLRDVRGSESGKKTTVTESGETGLSPSIFHVFLVVVKWTGSLHDKGKLVKLMFYFLNGSDGLRGCILQKLSSCKRPKYHDARF